MIASSFTPIPTGTAIAASAISYAPGAVTVTGAQRLRRRTESDRTLDGCHGAGIGTGTASWNPTISVVVPADFAAAVYTSTITHSVA